MRTCSALLALCLAWPAAAQQVFVVQGNYFGLRNAVQLARPGDVVLVRAGDYYPPRVTIGITILCDPGVSVGDAYGSAMIVQNVPAGQRLTVHGGTFYVGHAYAGLVIQGCAGAVVFEDSTNTRELQVTGCAHVAFNRCTLQALRVQQSTVVVSGGTVGSLISPAVQILGGEVVVHSAQVSSGSALFPSASVIELGAGTLTLTGDGAGVRAGSPTDPLIVTRAGTIRLDPAVQLVGSAPPITGPAQVIRTSIPAARGDGAAPGGTFSGSTYAPAGDLAFTFASGVVPPTPTPLGTLWVDARSPVLDAGIVPIGNVRGYTTRVPALPLPGVTLALQPLTLSPSLELRIGVPATVVLD